MTVLLVLRHRKNPCQPANCRPPWFFPVLVEGELTRLERRVSGTNPCAWARKVAQTTESESSALSFGFSDLVRPALTPVRKSDLSRLLLRRPSPPLGPSTPRCGSTARP